MAASQLQFDSLPHICPPRFITNNYLVFGCPVVAFSLLTTFLPNIAVLPFSFHPLPYHRAALSTLLPDIPFSGSAVPPERGLVVVSCLITIDRIPLCLAHLEPLNSVYPAAWSNPPLLHSVILNQFAPAGLLIAFLSRVQIHHVFIRKSCVSISTVSSDMPFMDEDCTDSDGSSHCSGLSPRSTATDATSISAYQEPNGCQKRKRKAVVMLPCKRSRTEPCLDGNAFHVDTTLRTATIELPQNRGADEPLYRHADSDAECTTGKFPTSVWKSVFMYLPPRCLGTLLTVNSVFHMLLTGSSPKPGGGHLSREVIHKDAERIWTLARQRHHPHLPRPLHGYRELDMWKLIGSSQCQFCVHSPGSPWQASNDLVGNHLTAQEPPHTDIHWPLAVRSCRECLGKHFLTVC